MLSLHTKLISISNSVYSFKFWQSFVPVSDIKWPFQFFPSIVMMPLERPPGQRFFSNDKHCQPGVHFTVIYIRGSMSPWPGGNPVTSSKPQNLSTCSIFHWYESSHILIRLELASWMSSTSIRFLETFSILMHLCPGTLTYASRKPPMTSFGGEAGKMCLTTCTKLRKEIQLGSVPCLKCATTQMPFKHLPKFCVSWSIALTMNGVVRCFLELERLFFPTSGFTHFTSTSTLLVISIYSAGFSRIDFSLGESGLSSCTFCKQMQHSLALSYLLGLSPRLSSGSLYPGL